MSSEAVLPEGAVRVVLADDDEGYLESLRILIERQPELTVVGAAADGLELLDLVERVRPDAAVIDLHMPRLGGVRAVEQLRRDHPAICLIALTGDGDSTLHAAATRAGADDVVLKSEMVERLVERLSAARAA